jgi:hypothetical protein
MTAVRSSKAGTSTSHVAPRRLGMLNTGVATVEVGVM